MGVERGAGARLMYLVPGARRMLDFKTQSHLADAMASILSVQLRATSATLGASMRGWRMWAQMLKMPSPIDERPMPAHARGPLQSSSVHWLRDWPPQRPRL